MIPSISAKDGDSVRVLIDAQVASSSELAELRFLSRGARWFSPATARAVIAALDGFPSPARIAEREALRAACVERLRREPNAGAEIKGVGGPGAARRDG